MSRPRYGWRRTPAELLKPSPWAHQQNAQTHKVAKAAKKQG